MGSGGTFHQNASAVRLDLIKAPQIPTPIKRNYQKTSEDEILKDQDKDRNLKKSVISLYRVLAIIGYGVITAFLILSGFKLYGFYLPTEVLIVLIISVMTSSTLTTLHRAVASLL